MTKSFRVGLGVLAALSAGGIVIVACGGDDSTGGGDTSDGGPTSDVTNPIDSAPPGDAGAPDTGPTTCTAAASDYLNDALQIAVSTDAVCAIRSDHSLVCWGDNMYGMVGIDAGTPNGYRPVSLHFPASSGALKFSSVAAGNGNLCALDTAGHVWCWGTNGSGELGTGTTSAIANQPFLPAEVVDRAGAPIANITALATGRHHSCAARSDGVLLCWGENDSSQLAGSDAGANAPFAIEMPSAPNLGATGVALNSGPLSYTTCGTSATAAAFCIGENGNGQLANPVPTVHANLAINAAFTDASATPPANGFGQTDVSTCALDSTKNLYCWGQNYGVFNGAIAYSASTAIPAKIPGLPPLVQSDQNDVTGCGVSSDGGVFCWGANDEGQLGIGSSDGGLELYPPSRVVGLDGTGVLPAATNVRLGNNTCAILAGPCGGSVVCWGPNFGNTIGNDAGAVAPSPVLVLAPNPDGGF